MNKQVATVEAGGVVKRDATPVSESAALLEVIARAASNPNVDVEKMGRLLQMQERVMARHAEQSFNEAMTAAQSEMHRVSADAENPQTKSKYATYGKLDKALRPIYTKHHFALSFDTGDAPHEEAVRVIAHVSHVAGHTRSYHADMPADGKGARGADVMTKTHATGAAMSYGMRYLLKMIFNVAIGEEDRDGNDDGAVISNEEREELSGLIDETGTDLAKFCLYMKVGCLADIHSKDLAKAKTALEAKKRQKAASDADI